METLQKPVELLRALPGTSRLVADGEQGGIQTLGRVDPNP